MVVGLMLDLRLELTGWGTVLSRRGLGVNVLLFIVMMGQYGDARRHLTTTS